MVNLNALRQTPFGNSNNQSSKPARFPKSFDIKKFSEDTGIQKLPLVVDEEYEISFLLFPVTENHPAFSSIQKLFGNEKPYDWAMNITTHTVNTPNGYSSKIVCPLNTYQKPCPLCQERNNRLNNDTWNGLSEECKPLKTSVRNMFVVLNHKDNNVYLFDMSDFFFGQELERKLARSSKDDQHLILADPSADGVKVKFFIDPGTSKDGKGNPLPGKASNFEFIPRGFAIPQATLDEIPAIDTYITLYSEQAIIGMLDGSWFMVEEEAPAVEEPRQTIGTPTSKVIPQSTPAPQQSTESNEDAAAKRRAIIEARKKQQQPATPTCPQGGAFGSDNAMLDACESCEVFDECSQAYEAMNVI